MLRQAMTIVLIVGLFFIGGCIHIKPKTGQTTVSATDINSLPVLVIGQTITVENSCAVTVDKIECIDKLGPFSPDCYRDPFIKPLRDSYITNTFVHIVMHVKNLAETPQKADSFLTVALEHKWNGQYFYGFHYAIEVPVSNGENQLTFYTNKVKIDPLASGVMHFWVNMPKAEVSDNTNPKVMIFTIHGQKYQFRLDPIPL